MQGVLDGTLHFQRLRHPFQLHITHPTFRKGKDRGLGSLVFLEILRLFEDFLAYLVAVNERVSVFAKEEDEVDLQLGLDENFLRLAFCHAVRWVNRLAQQVRDSLRLQEAQWWLIRDGLR